MKRANFDSFEQIDTNNEIKFGKKKVNNNKYHFN